LAQESGTRCSEQWSLEQGSPFPTPEAPGTMQEEITTCRPDTSKILLFRKTVSALSLLLHFSRKTTAYFLTAHINHSSSLIPYKCLTTVILSTSTAYCHSIFLKEKKLVFQAF